MRLIGLLLFFALSGTLLAQPAGYEFIEHRGKLVRNPIESLPLRVYSNDQKHFSALLHAFRTWNDAGHKQGYPDLFAPVDNVSDADFFIDWSGKGLPADKAAGVFWNFQSDQVQISKIVVDPLHKIPEGNRAQILLQELGHTLGLGDSSHRKDVMHPIMHTRRQRKANSARLTARDLAAFQWLYQQNEFLPIVSAARDSVEESPEINGPSLNALEIEPLKVELTGSVNVRVTVKNPTETTLRAPMTLILSGRGRGEQAWRQLKVWKGLQKVPAGYKISRDYFSAMKPLFLGSFELRCKVQRDDTKEVLAERYYP